MARSIFISYKRNHEASEAVVAALERELGQEFELWRDKSMVPGKFWSNELYGWLLGCGAGIAVVCDEALKADWCRREWSVLAARAQATNLAVLPIRLGSEHLTTGILDDIQFTPWSESTIDVLRHRLRALPPHQASARDFLAAHHTWLRWQFNDGPVLGQEPYALKDVYVETECGRLKWGDISQAKPGHSVDPFQQKHGGRHALVDVVLDHLGQETFRDLIVVQAGPGSGKSAFTLRIACELLAQGFLPILVRFRDLRLGLFTDIAKLIDDAILIGATKDTSPQPRFPVVESVLDLQHTFRGVAQCKAVFILDGWDEVSLTGSVKYQDQIRAWLPRMREYFIGRRGNGPLRVLLTGRPSLEVGGSGVLQRDTPILTMRPMRPEQLEHFTQAIQRKLQAFRAAVAAMASGGSGTGSATGTGGPKEIWQIDLNRLGPVFEHYRGWFDRYSQGDNGSDTAISEVLGNPLLAYLSLRVFAESQSLAENLLEEPTALYHELIETTVRHAGKGRDEQLDQHVLRGGEALHHLLQEVACTISLLRGESVSYDELALRFANPNLPLKHELLSTWTQTQGENNALRELVVNFYFKGGNLALGCEFLHKSFREYLYAEALVRALSDAVACGDRPESYPNASDAYASDFAQHTVEFKLSRRLAYLLAPQWLTGEVERHLKWLLHSAALKDLAHWRRARDLLTNIYAWWAEGVHLRPQRVGGRSEKAWSPPYVNQLFAQSAPFDDPNSRFTPVRATALDAHLGHALMRLTCMLHSLMHDRGPDEGPQRRSAYQSIDGNGMVRFKPGGNGFMPALIARLDADGWRRNPGLACAISGPVDLADENLDRSWAVQVNWSAADIRRCSLKSARLDAADLSHSDISRADLFDANLVRAQLTNACLVQARLACADLRDADLRGADLTAADLRGANLRGALLQGACLVKAMLQDADLRGANLQSVDLEGADLAGASVTAVALKAAKNAPRHATTKRRTSKFR